MIRATDSEEYHEEDGKEQPRMDAFSFGEEYTSFYSDSFSLVMSSCG